MPTPSEQRVRDFSDGVSRGDPERTVAQTHPDVEFFSVLAMTSGEPFRGHDGIRAYFREVRSAWVDWDVQLDEVAEAPDGRVAVAITMHVRGRGSGAEFDQRVGHVWRLEDGLLRQCTPFSDPADAFREVGLERGGSSSVR